MDSLNTNTKNFVKIEEQHCIAQVMAVAEKGGFRLFVAWEWEDQAKKGVFGFAKSRKLYNTFTWEDVKETADYGWDIGGTGEELKVFANLFYSHDKKELVKEIESLKTQLQRSIYEKEAVEELLATLKKSVKQDYESSH